MVAASGSLPHCRSSTLLPFACCLVGAGTSTHNDFFELSFFSCVVYDVSFGLHRVPGCLQSWFLRFSLYSSCRCRCLLVHPVSRFGVGASSNLWMFPCFCWCRFGCSLLGFCRCRFYVVATSGSLPRCRFSTLLPFACRLVGVGTCTHNALLDLPFFACFVYDVGSGLHRVPGCIQG